MRPDLYRRLAPMITVFSRQPGVNAQVAPREVLLAIPGVTTEMVDEYIAQRAEALARGEPAPAFAAATGFTAGNSMMSSVRSEARLDDGTYFAREAVALLRAAPRRPVTFLSWRESTALPEPSPASAQPQGAHR
jgi:general secretion pathway protein K